MTPPLCFHGRTDCAYCGVGRPKEPGRRKRKAPPVPDAAQIAVPRCPACGVNQARRSVIGLYTKVCPRCEKKGVSAPGLAPRRKGGI